MFPEPLTVPTVPAAALASWTWVLGHMECTGVCACPREPPTARANGGSLCPQSPGPQVRRPPGKGWDLAGQQAGAIAWTGALRQRVRVEGPHLAPPSPQPGAPAQAGSGLGPGLRDLSQRSGRFPQLISRIENLSRLGSFSMLCGDAASITLGESSQTPHSPQ